MLINTIKRHLSLSSKQFKFVKLKNSRGGSSNEWLSRQLTDPYVEKAKIMNYRCRSAFKLLEIDERYQILKPGQIVIDCGAAPGSWTQVAVRKVNADNFDKSKTQGKVISIDKQQIYPIEGAIILGNMDFTSSEAQKKLLDNLNDQKSHVVLSDMAPKATGVADLDNENILHLCYMTLRFAVQVSEIGSSLIVKLWQCGQAKQLESDINKFYNNVKFVKPNASRSDSSEIFLLGRDFKGLKK